MLLVAGNKNAVAAAVHAVNRKDGAAEHLLPVLGGLGKLHLKIRDTGVLRLARCGFKRHRAFFRVIAFHGDCTAVQIGRCRRAVLVNAGHVQLIGRACAVSDKAVLAPLAQHINVLVGLAAACRLALIAGQRTVGVVVYRVYSGFAVINNVVLAGQDKQLAMHVKTLAAAAAVQLVQQLLAAVLYFLIVRVQLYGIQLAARMDDERQVFFVIIILVREDSGDRNSLAVRIGKPQQRAPSIAPLREAALVCDNVHRTRRASIVDLGLIRGVVQALEALIVLGAFLGFCEIRHRNLTRHSLLLPVIRHSGRSVLEGRNKFIAKHHAFRLAVLVIKQQRRSQSPRQCHARDPVVPVERRAVNRRDFRRACQLLVTALCADGVLVRHRLHKQAVKQCRRVAVKVNVRSGRFNNFRQCQRVNAFNSRRHALTS